MLRAPHSHAPLPFPLGSLLEDKFILQSILGKGAMGVVYLGFDRFLERHVAIKVLRKRNLTQEAIERFRQEAVTMATLAHRNIIQIYSFGERGGFYYFVMEYLAGRTLLEFIQNRAQNGAYLPLDVAIGIISQVCSGLGAVHKLGIAHRDVKPANILISELSYHIALTDFGLTYLNTDKEHSFVEGTPLYLAPETIQSARQDTSLAHLGDIYAVGCILYELLTGSPPFESDSVITILSKHVRDPIPKATDKRPDIPSYANDVIAKAMAKDPFERFRSCEEFKTYLTNQRISNTVLDIPRPYLLIFDPKNTAEQLQRAIRQHAPRIYIRVLAQQEAALASTLNDKPDAIVLVESPEKYSLLEFCSLLQHTQLPLFLYLKENSTAMKFLYTELGVYGVFTSPADMVDLTNTITTLLG